MTTQQYAQDYSVEFHATVKVNGEQKNLHHSVIKFGPPDSPGYSTNIVNARGFINEIRKLAPGADIGLKGNKIT